ncbi:MAG TPA: hypothetical protein VI916_12680 [Acidimicrobiia bacterium]|nr:hypothetical protein [Acidimicrobiia bacterium]
MTYLVGAIALSALLAWLVVWWHRRPKSMTKGIDEFREAREAIAPRRPPTPRATDGDPDGGEPGLTDPNDPSGR